MDQDKILGVVKAEHLENTFEWEFIESRQVTAVLLTVSENSVGMPSHVCELIWFKHDDDRHY